MTASHKRRRSRVLRHAGTMPVDSVQTAPDRLRRGSHVPFYRWRVQIRTRRRRRLTNDVCSCRRISCRVLQRREDARRGLRRAAAIDQLQQLVQIDPFGPRQPLRQIKREPGAHQPPGPPANLLGSILRSPAVDAHAPLASAERSCLRTPRAGRPHPQARAATSAIRWSFFSWASSVIALPGPAEAKPHWVESASWSRG